MAGAIFQVTVPATIIRSACLGDARKASMPNRDMSNRGQSRSPIISNAQHASPKDRGNTEDLRPQLSMASIEVTARLRFRSSGTSTIDEGLGERLGVGRLEVVYVCALNPVNLPRRGVQGDPQAGAFGRFRGHGQLHSRAPLRHAYSHPIRSIPTKTAISNRTNSPNCRDITPKLAAQGNRKTTSTSKTTKTRAME